MHNKEEYIRPYFEFVDLQVEYVTCQSGDLGIEDWNEDPDAPISF
jgi:hypothetical protein